MGQEGLPASSLNASSSQNAAESTCKDGGNKRPREGIVWELPQSGTLIWDALWPLATVRKDKRCDYEWVIVLKQSLVLKGKTSLAHQFVEGEFLEGYDPTVENSK